MIQHSTGNQTQLGPMKPFLLNHSRIDKSSRCILATWEMNVKHLLHPVMKACNGAPIICQRLWCWWRECSLGICEKQLPSWGVLGPSMSTPGLLLECDLLHGWTCGDVEFPEGTKNWNMYRSIQWQVWCMLKVSGTLRNCINQIGTAKNMVNPRSMVFIMEGWSLLGVPGVGGGEAMISNDAIKFM